MGSISTSNNKRPLQLKFLEDEQQAANSINRVDFHSNFINIYTTPCRINSQLDELKLQTILQK